MWAFDQSSQLLVDEEAGLLDRVVVGVLAPLARWDGLHFVAIARGKCAWGGVGGGEDGAHVVRGEDGYRAEHQHAFYPGLPGLIRGVGEVLAWPGVLGLTSCLLLAGVLVSVLAFCASVREFDELSGRLLKSKGQARVAGIMYRYNPANVFVLAVYTESLFAFLTFRGVNCVLRGERVAGALWLAAAALVRSNGVLGVLVFVPLVLGGEVVKGVLLGGLVCVPSAAFQLWTFAKYCGEQQVRNRPPYCDTGAVWSVYSSIQARYWGVGLLKYWRLEQLPNFALAAPVLVVSAVGLYRFWTSWRVRSRRWPLGVLEVLYVHWAVCLAVSVLVLHVQVATRFMASCAPLYWELARTRGRQRKAVVLWLVIWQALGVVMFGLFYPWT